MEENKVGILYWVYSFNMVDEKPIYSFRYNYVLRENDLIELPKDHVIVKKISHYIGEPLIQNNKVVPGKFVAHPTHCKLQIKVLREMEE